MRSALVLFDASPYCLDSAGYLSHLSIELLLKVLLLAVKGEFPATHSVQQLFRDLQRELPETVLTDRGEYTLTLVDGWVSFGIRGRTILSKLEMRKSIS